jgi:uncharacterized membrane protein
MIKYLKISGFAYILLALFSLYSSYTRWNNERDNAYIFLGFAVLLIFMFFFKRSFIKRYEKRAKNQNKNKS